MFNSVEEIRNAFIKEGWSDEIKFSEFTLEQAQEKGCNDIADEIMDGKKFFIMEDTGNVFDSKGEVAMYNISCVNQEMTHEELKEINNQNGQFNDSPNQDVSYKWQDPIEQAQELANEEMEDMYSIQKYYDFVDELEDLGWNVELDDNDCITLSQYTPAGEDFSFEVEFHDGNMKDIYREMYEYYQGFDVEDHVQMWLEAKSNGVSGVPGVVDLVEDAQEIDRMLEEVSDLAYAYAFNDRHKEISEHHDIDEEER